MNRYDENYSAYFAAPDEAYPLGSAVDATNEDNLDGTPILAAFFNDVIGFMQATFFGAFGKDAQVSGEPESCIRSNVWEAIQKFVEDKVQVVKDAVAEINGKIPAQASAENQLADKDFVNSSIEQLNAKTAELSADGKSFDGNAASATKLATARNINGVAFDGTKDITLVVSANATHFGTCPSAAATQVKSVSIAGFVLVAGARVSVLFPNGNTAGSLRGNSITQESAPMLNVQSTGAKLIKVGSAYAGPNFVNAGEVHDFVYDGSAWNDVTASVIFKGSNSNGNYVKHRDGLIEQWVVKRFDSVGWHNWTFPIRFSFDPNVQNSTNHNGDDNWSIVRNVTTTSADIGCERRVYACARGY